MKEILEKAINVIWMILRGEQVDVINKNTVKANKGSDFSEISENKLIVIKWELYIRVKWWIQRNNFKFFLWIFYVIVFYIYIYLFLHFSI